MNFVSFLCLNLWASNLLLTIHFSKLFQWLTPHTGLWNGKRIHVEQGVMSNRSFCTPTRLTIKPCVVFALPKKVIANHFCSCSLTEKTSKHQVTNSWQFLPRSVSELREGTCVKDWVCNPEKEVNWYQLYRYTLQKLSAINCTKYICNYSISMRISWMR